MIDAIGADVRGWKVGERAGVGWHGGHCVIAILAIMVSSFEIFPLERAAEAYERMMSGKARFRVVIRMEA